MNDQPNNVDWFDNRIAPLLQQEYLQELASATLAAKSAKQTNSDISKRVRNQIESSLVGPRANSAWKSKKFTDVLVVGSITCAVCLFLIVFGSLNQVDSSLDNPLKFQFSYSNLVDGSAHAPISEKSEIDLETVADGLDLVDTSIAFALQSTDYSGQEFRGMIQRLAGVEVTRSQRSIATTRFAGFQKSENQLVASIANRLLGYR